VFGNDGRLLGASRRAGLPPFDDADYGLRPVAVDQVGAFVFAHGEATPAVGLRESLGSMAGHLESISQSVGTFLTETRLTIEGNWKLAMSGSVEDYHATFVHQQATARVRPGENTTTLEENGQSWFRLDAPVPPALRAALRVLTGKEPRPDLTSYCIFPNVTVVTIWSLVQVTNWIPLAPGRTLRVTRYFSERARPGRFSPRRLLAALLARLVRRRARKVMVEDQWIVGEAQAGTRASTDLARGPAHVQEARVEHLLAEVARRLGYRYREE
jgi:phenylpropionate dioxygenase-like ring-hydroxylating dioxygenase large terminal subunit